MRNKQKNLLFIGTLIVILICAWAFTKKPTDRIHSKEKPEMVFVKGGSFFMGQEDGEEDEKPVHKVQLSNFYIGKYEITVAQFRDFCEATDRAMPREPKWGLQDDHPIVNTTWNDAAAYVSWLNISSSQNYRLPTEAEFDYVIRNGGKSGIYPWGTGLPRNENIADESIKKTGFSRSVWDGYDDGYASIAPVGSFPPNELGVHDINGNVWEWVSDWYSEFMEKAVKDPQGPASGKFKVGKGASFNADPWHCRTASRAYVAPDFQGPGFRLAKDAE